MTKIMLIEDDENLAHLTKTALIARGHEVAFFHNPRQAMEMALKQTPDIILMDIMLPGLSGAETIKELKKFPALKDVPVLFLTGLVSGGEDAVEKTGITVDGINYQALGKPYEMERLLKIMDTVLKK